MGEAGWRQGEGSGTVISVQVKMCKAIEVLTWRLQAFGKPCEQIGAQSGNRRGLLFANYQAFFGLAKTLRVICSDAGFVSESRVCYNN